MVFKEILAYIFYGIIAILILSSGAILITWGFDMVSMDNPPTLMEAAQSFMDFWVEKAREIPGARDFLK